jgi:hypothetical protein
VLLVALTPEGRALVDGTAANEKSSPAGLVELLPSVKPIPKNTAQSATSPKKNANIFPVPTVISVS